MPTSDGRVGHRDLCTAAVVERTIGPASVSSLKIAASLQSDNFSSGSAGWKIERDTGSAEFQDVTVRGTLNADDITVGTLDVARIAAGTITATQIAALTITAGEIAADTITGGQIATNTITALEMQVNAIGAAELAALNISVGKHIRSTTYTPGSAGWSIDADGSAEFQDVTVRGEVNAATGTLTDLTVDGTLTMNATGVFKTAASGVRLEIQGSALTSRIRFFDAAGVESFIQEGALRDIQLVGGGGLITMHIRGTVGDGHVRVSGPVRHADGTAAKTSVSFFNDIDLGLYRFGANDMAIAANSTAVARFKQAGENQGPTSRQDGALFIDTAYHELDSGAGSIIAGQSWEWDVGANLSSLELQVLRDAAGSSHTTAAIGFRRITDTTSQSSLWFTSSGVGIGTSGPSKVLTVAGTISAAPRTHTTGGQATAWFNVSGSDYELSRNTSSKRYKQNVKSLIFDAARYGGLRPVTFNPKDKTERDSRNGRLAIGQIAEEVADLYPELAVYDEQGRPEGIDQSFIHLNTAAILDLMQRVETLEAA